MVFMGWASAYKPKAALSRRSKCRERATKRPHIRLRKGDVIVFEEPIRFRLGEDKSEFRVISVRPFYLVDPKCEIPYYYIERRKLAERPCRIMRDGKVIYDSRTKAGLKRAN